MRNAAGIEAERPPKRVAIDLILVQQSTGIDDFAVVYGPFVYTLEEFLVTFLTIH
jgi:hypothetical protein